jgi:hypothetical protein
MFYYELGNPKIKLDKSHISAPNKKMSASGGALSSRALKALNMCVGNE